MTNWKTKLKGFIFQKDFGSKEEMALAIYCTMNQLPFKKIPFSKKIRPEIPDGFVPCGSIQWITSILGKTVTPKYYPDFLSSYLYRKVWETDKWPLGEKVFIKPADKHKRFNGFVTNGGYKGKKRGPYWCSEVTSFENEWRYYVAHGKVIIGEWYSGDEINVPDAPSIEHIEFPEDYYASVDMGMSNGKLTLVEAHEPFSCGWYGKDYSKYAEWLSEGWFNRERWL